MHQENVTQLIEQVNGLGFSDQVADQIMRKMGKNVTEFTALEYAEVGEDTLTYDLHFKNDKNSSKSAIHLETIGVLLEKKPAVKQWTITEELLRKDNLPLEALQIIKEDEKRYWAEIEKEMKYLMRKDPDVFNLLLVKYNPPLNFVIPDRLRKQQQIIQDGLTNYNTFPGYLNLQPLEMYNLMDGRYVLKRTIDIEKLPNIKNSKTRMDESWIKVDFSSDYSLDGFLTIDIFPANFDIAKDLNRYGFEELRKPDSKIHLVSSLKMGCRVLVHKNKDDPSVIEANPPKNKIKLDTFNFYHKKQLLSGYTTKKLSQDLIVQQSKKILYHKDLAVNKRQVQYRIRKKARHLIDKVAIIKIKC